MPTLSAPDVLLDVQHLTTVFHLGGAEQPAVDDVSFRVHRGETLGLVGESGSGKSVTALSLLRLVQFPGVIRQGRVTFQGLDLLELPERRMREVRGARIGLVFQEPQTALNPVFTVGDQLAEAMIVHGIPRGAARQRAVDLLGAVQLPAPAQRAREYPHQLSGGMRQRVLIAMALACRPSLLIADEPTTALDATVQAQILELLREMREAFGLSMLLITHDFGVVAGMADRVAVMYAGRIVEEAPVARIFRTPVHPYTRALLSSIPATSQRRPVEPIDTAGPSLVRLPHGCPFAPRCTARRAECDITPPGPVAVADDHHVRCHLAGAGR